MKFEQHGDWLMDHVMCLGIARVKSLHGTVYSVWSDPQDEFEMQWIASRDSSAEAVRVCEELVEA